MRVQRSQLAEGVQSLPPLAQVVSLAIAHLSSLHMKSAFQVNVCMQVSFGVHEEEESAARQYDRALLIEKGRAAKTNFPLPDYEKESKEFEEFVAERYSWHALHAAHVIKHTSRWQHAGRIGHCCSCLCLLSVLVSGSA